MTMKKILSIKIGILTVSDRASKGVYEDHSGQEIIRLLKQYLKNPWVAIYRVIPDEKELIARELKRMVDKDKCCLVVTTGGTGPAPRDVTPEATETICQKLLPGFGELMRMNSLKYVPTAILSRQTAGIRGKALIVNLPGKPKSIQQCLGVIFPAIPACIELAGGPVIACRGKHKVHEHHCEQHHT